MASGGTRQKIRERVKDRLENPGVPTERRDEGDAAPSNNLGVILGKDQAPFEQAVGLYLHVRNELDRRIDEFVDSITQISAQKEQLAGIIRTLLEQNGQESARTAHGTASLSTRRSCKLTDPAEFMDWVIENKQFDLIERRGAAIPIDDWSKENGGQLPPGCQINRLETISVRKS